MMMEMSINSRALLRRKYSKSSGIPWPLSVSVRCAIPRRMGIIAARVVARRYNTAFVRQAWQVKSLYRPRLEYTKIANSGPSASPAGRTLDARHSYGQDLAGMLSNGPSVYHRSHAVKILHFLGIGRLPKRPMIDATGGTERSALEIARIQTRRGHNVTVACNADEHWEGSWEGVRILHLKPYTWLKKISFGKIAGWHLPLAMLVRTGRFDLVHFHEYLRTRYFTAQ